jgi:hypothetical protein
VVFPIGSIDPIGMKANFPANLCSKGFGKGLRQVARHSEQDGVKGIHWLSFIRKLISWEWESAD